MNTADNDNSVQEYERLWNVGVSRLRSNKRDRDAADKFLEAFHAAPDKWSEFRWVALAAHTRVLTRKDFEHSQADINALEAIILDEDEPYLYRTEAAYGLAVMRSVVGDLEQLEEAAALFRKTIRLSRQAEAQEKRRRIPVPSGTGEGFQEQAVGSILKGTSRKARKDWERLEDPYKDPSNGISPEDFRTVVPFADVNVERLSIGGNRCDCCAKTLDQLHMKSLVKCARCKRAYYCGVDCQRTCWMEGHCDACRLPDQIEPGDYMRLKNLQRKPELNGRVVKVLGQTPNNGRYRVMLRDDLIPISVAGEKLMHIRPSK